MQPSRVIKRRLIGSDVFPIVICSTSFLFSIISAYPRPVLFRCYTGRFVRFTNAPECSRFRYGEQFLLLFVHSMPLQLSCAFPDIAVFHIPIACCLSMEKGTLTRHLGHPTCHACIMPFGWPMYASPPQPHGKRTVSSVSITWRRQGTVL